MKSDNELFQMITGVIEQMAGDVLDVPTRDYFGPDMLGDPLTDDEFERLAVIKEHVHMQMQDYGTNHAIILITWEES